MFPQDCISQGLLALVDSSPVTSQLNINPRRQQVNPCGYLLPLFRLLSSQIKLQRREVRSSSMLGRVCVSDRANQTNGSAVSQPYPCSSVQGLHFRQTLQSPDSDFSRQVAACLVHMGNRYSSLVSWRRVAKSIQGHRIKSRE